ncbi:hypothetical protein RJ639_022206 [Escallonia herrerae]|uniref:Uncharacterized protein n=1 Tax=Escallonia herrerae TaxID=1293975 RepID=A0AA88V3R2_9ASTE|nr:hypothetical protein RJ639_022206 [Escallonia herrerae]
MTTLQRSAYSFRRQGSSGRIWDTRLQLSEPKSGELHAAIPRGNNQEDRFYDEELVDSQSSAASPPSGKQEKIPHSRSGKRSKGALLLPFSDDVDVLDRLPPRNFLLPQLYTQELAFYSAE